MMVVLEIINKTRSLANSSMVKIAISNEVAWLSPLPSTVCQALLSHMLAPYVEMWNAKEHTLTLHIVRDAHIMALNALHMQCMGPTNVLSFPALPMTGNGEDVPLLWYEAQEHADILVLSVDTLHRECLLYGQELLAHTLRLLAHGLGHILGYDHGEEMFALCAEMEDRGREFLERKGM